MNGIPKGAELKKDQLAGKRNSSPCAEKYQIDISILIEASVLRADSKFRRRYNRAQ